MPFVTTWIAFEDFMLTEIRWNANNAWFHSYVEYKKQTKINEQTELNKNKHVDI